jgi:FAD/FMN-containing dehydrogenase
LTIINADTSRYMNEADVLEEDWQGAFFGDNYPKLLKIKEKYDPTGVFTCWKCVGWSSDHTPASECYKTV